MFILKMLACILTALIDHDSSIFLNVAADWSNISFPSSNSIIRWSIARLFCRTNQGITYGLALASLCTWNSILRLTQLFYHFLGIGSINTHEYLCCWPKSAVWFADRQGTWLYNNGLPFILQIIITCLTIDYLLKW